MKGIGNLYRRLLEIERSCGYKVTEEHDVDIAGDNLKISYTRGPFTEKAIFEFDGNRITRATEWVD